MSKGRKQTGDVTRSFMIRKKLNYKKNDRSIGEHFESLLFWPPFLKHLADLLPNISFLYHESLRFWPPFFYISTLLLHTIRVL